LLSYWSLTKYDIIISSDDHKRVHAGEKFFVCDWPGCTRSYTQNSHLVWNLYTIYCYFNWITFEWHLQRKHQLIHMEEKPFCMWLADVTIGLSAPVMSLTIRSLTPERNDLFANSLNVGKGSPEAIIWRYGSNKLGFNSYILMTSSEDTKRPLIQMSSKKKKSNKYWFDDWIKLWIKLI